RRLSLREVRAARVGVRHRRHRRAHPAFGWKNHPGPHRSNGAGAAPLPCRHRRETARGNRRSRGRYSARRRRGRRRRRGQLRSPCVGILPPPPRPYLCRPRAHAGFEEGVMKVTGTHTVMVSQERAYALLQDPDVMAKCMPGTEALIKIGEAEYEMKMKVVL